MKLNIGCGRDVRDGWVNVDVAEYDTWAGGGFDARNVRRMSALIVEAMPIMVRDDYTLPFHDDTFEGAVAHHVMQMIGWPWLVVWLEEVRRVLKPGAWLRITVPDAIGAVRARDADRIAWFPIADEHERSIDGKLCMYLSQAGATRSLFTAPWLMELCERAGFEYVIAPNAAIGVTMTSTPWITELDSRLKESICVEARK